MYDAEPTDARAFFRSGRIAWECIFFPSRPHVLWPQPRGTFDSSTVLLVNGVILLWHHLLSAQLTPEYENPTTDSYQWCRRKHSPD